MNKVEKKRIKEQETIEKMIHIYCIKNHHTKELCSECEELVNYAKARSQRCPFMAEKTFCAHCKVHCYRPEMRERIRKVMRFSGPRMIIYAPKTALWHMLCTIKERILK